MKDSSVAGFKTHMGVLLEKGWHAEKEHETAETRRLEKKQCWLSKEAEHLEDEGAVGDVDSAVRKERENEIQKINARLAEVREREKRYVEMEKNMLLLSARHELRKKERKKREDEIQKAKQAARLPEVRETEKGYAEMEKNMLHDSARYELNKRKSPKLDIETETSPKPQIVITPPVVTEPQEERIRRLVFRMSSPGPARPCSPLTSIEPVPLPPEPIIQEHRGPSEVPLCLQPSQAPQAHVVPFEIPAEGRVPTVDVLRATSEGQDHLAWQWTKKDCNVLVDEVASRILQKNWDMMLPLSEKLLAQLCENVQEWNVLVKPSVRSCEEVASAVYKELCKGQEKRHVMHAALVQDDFSSEVLDIIQRYLTAPPKKRRTLGSFLRSVCSAICRR